MPLYFHVQSERPTVELDAEAGVVLLRPLGGAQEVVVAFTRAEAEALAGALLNLLLQPETAPANEDGA